MPNSKPIANIDALDTRLLTLLQADSTIGNAEIGQRIGLSASQVSRRRTRLEEEGVITAYRAVLSGNQLGFRLNALIRVSLHSHSAAIASQFREMVSRIDEIQLACAITGDADYLLHVKLQDLEALSRLINEQLLSEEIIREVRSDVVLEMLKESSSLPLSLQGS